MCTRYPALSGKSILVADDFPAIARFLHDVFRECGARVTPVTDGREAMLRAQLGTFDLILLDLVMPRPDGWDVLEFLRRVRPELVRRTILVTGDRLRRQTLDRALKTGLPIVEKPFNVDYLRALASATILRAASEAQAAGSAGSAGEALEQAGRLSAALKVQRLAGLAGRGARRPLTARWRDDGDAPPVST